jgi:hypothetical protein
MGQFKFLLADFDLDFAPWPFDWEDFVLLLFARERNARLFAVRFAAMALFMLILSHASYKLRFLLYRWSRSAATTVYRFEGFHVVRSREG